MSRQDSSLGLPNTLTQTRTINFEALSHPTLQSKPAVTAMIRDLADPRSVVPNTVEERCEDRRDC